MEYKYLFKLKNECSLSNRIYIITASFIISNAYKHQLTLTSVAAEHSLLLSKHMYAHHMKLLDSENSDMQCFMYIFKSKNIYLMTVVYFIRCCYLAELQ